MIWIIISIGVFATIIILLNNITKFIAQYFAKKRLTLFMNSYNAINLGMSKEMVVGILGEKYTRNIAHKTESTIVESLTWHCKASVFNNLDIENKTATIVFEDNMVTSIEIE